MTRSSDLVMVERELDQPSIATKQATDETAASVLSEPPEAWADCETCGGEGAINRTIHVYENGCGFSHPDVEIIPCTDCMGTGGAIVDAASTYCDICGGDCSSANPPVFNCPLAKQESCPESAPRTETATVTALRECQRVLAMMIDPESIKSTSVIHAFAAATAAEAKARTVLNGVTTFDGGVEGHAVNSCHIDHVVRHAHEHDQGRSALSSPPKYKAAGIKPGPSDQLTKTPSADHDDGNLRSLDERQAVIDALLFTARESLSPSSDPEGGARGVQGSTADGQQCNEQQPQALSRAYGVIDPDYARIFTIARCLAWAEGYALAMHGSFTRDLDLIAVPWAARACDPEHLAKRIESAAGLKITVPPKNDKPHNRLVWTMTFPEFGDPRFVDLSIIPPQHEVELSEEDVRMIDQAWETHKAALPLTAQALAEEIHIQMSVNKTCVVSGANALAKALLEKFKITQLTKTPSADHDDGNLRGLSAPNHQPHAVSQGWRDDRVAVARALYEVGRKAIEPTLGMRLCDFEQLEGRDLKLHLDYADAAIKTLRNPPLPAPPSPAKTGGAE